jgi:ABC-type glycerol-3-phosphate transport system substrate-binding protein
MIFSLAACGNGSGNGGDTTPPPADAGNEPPAETADSSGTGVTRLDETRTIKIGLWWDEYYDSTHQDIYANPNMSDELRAQAIFDNLKEVEEKYNVRIEYVNLTWDGTIESINTSIMAGNPDMDIYMADLQFGVPAVLNGFAQAIEDFAPAGSDVLGAQKIMKRLNLLDDPKNYLFAKEEKDAYGYPLGFNVAMIQEANLEDPRDLYDRGEWTWDVWSDYLLKLTKDTNNDGVYDVYGYGGFWTNMLENMLPANNTHIAGDKTEGLSDPKTIEVMEFLQKIYVTDKTARPWNQDDWDTNLQPFVDGKMAFFVTKDWIIQKFAGENGVDLTFELGVVPWPYGPSGKKEDSQKYLAEGNWCIIPVGVKDPALVYSVYYDYINWFKDDTDWRDEGGKFDWQADQYQTQRNMDMAVANGSISAFDLWPTLGLGDDFSMVPIMDGEKTPAQYAEETRQLVQDRLKVYFGD